MHIILNVNKYTSLSRQEAPNSVGGSEKKMSYNADDEEEGDDDDDDGDDDDGDDDDDSDGDGDDDDDVDVDVRACAVEMHMDISQEPFWVVNYKENGRGHLRGHCFVRACAIEMHMDISQEPFWVVNYKENGRGHLRGHCFVRACEVAMHMDISQEPFCVEIFRENAKRDGYHLDWTPGLNCYRKNPLVWPHGLGKKCSKQGLERHRIMTFQKFRFKTERMVRHRLHICTQQ